MKYSTSEIMKEILGKSYDEEIEKVTKSGIEIARK